MGDLVTGYSDYGSLGVYHFNVVANAENASVVIDSHTTTNPTCALPSGRLVINASGTGDIQYSNNNGLSWQASNTFSGLSPGSYYIMARLADNPETSVAYPSNPLIIAPVPSAPIISAPNVTQPTLQLATGSIVVNATGQGTLRYSINNGSSWHASNAFSGLAPGNYLLRARLLSDTSCSSVYFNNPVVINNPPVPTPTPTPTPTPAPTPNPNLPPPPLTVHASQGTYSDRVVVSWNKPSGINSFKIYRTQSIGGNPIQIAQLADNNFTDTTILNVKYLYYVSSVNLEGEGSKSSPAEGWRADPFSLDSDDDGMTDGEELLRGSNPHDRGSVQRLLGREVCSEWNGFLNPMFQVKEIANISSNNISGITSLYSIDGSLEASTLTPVTPNGKIDLLTHDLSGFRINSYGRVCADVGTPGIVDGGMTFYKYPSSPSATDNPSFVFMAPFLPAISGSQFVGINTFQPSLRPGESNNLVTNWIQLSNASKDKVLSGNLLFYLSGSSEPVCVRSVTLFPSQRFDTPAHTSVPSDRQESCSQLGAYKIGFVEWRPLHESRNISATVRNVRYIYDNQYALPSFVTAFQLPAEVGNGEAIFAPIDTREATFVLEVFNVLDEFQTVKIEVFNQNGQFVADLSSGFTSRQSLHFVLDNILPNSLGVVRVKGSRTEGVLATGMQYGRKPDASISWMYGILAGQAFGESLSGGFNTFLNQDCKILLINTHEETQNVKINLLDSTGSILRTQDETLTSKAVQEFSCHSGQDNQYGSVKVSSKNNSILGTIIRKGFNNSYRFPTPLRSIH